MASQTLRSLLSLPTVPERLSRSALVLIACQNTYREGIMRLPGVEPALVQCAMLLSRARDSGVPVIHVRHDAGPGTPYDVESPIGQIADMVEPRAGEPVITKNFPSAFEQTELATKLKRFAVSDIVFGGFMTHACVSSTARAAFNNGYRSTVVASATATRTLPNPMGGELSSSALQSAALTSLADIYAIIVRSEREVLP
jgi:nicotinamidase-related amidase